MGTIGRLSRSTTIQVSNPVADFEHAVVAEAQQVNANFKRFQEQLKTDPSSYLYEDVKERSDEFRAAMIKWQTQVDPKHNPLSLDFQSQNTWEEVIAMVEWAKENYENPEGRWGLMRRCFRKLAKKTGTTAPPLDGWMALLPSQSEYASVICGGIKLIIGAVATMNGVRDDIFDALEDIPQRMDSAGRAVKAQKSLRLKELASDLYIAVIDVLYYILLWLNEKLPKRIFKPIISQSSYGDALKQRTTKVSKFVNLIKDEVQLGAAEGIEELKERMVYQLIQYGNKKAWDVADPTILTHITTLFEDDPRLSGRQESRLGDAIFNSNFTKGQLLSFLEVQTNVPSEEVQSPLDQDRAAWFMRSAKLREWLTSAKSQTLLVNGNCSHLETSPLASNCIRLLKSLEPIASIYTVHYFCNSNDREFTGNYIRSAVQILQTFIGQILTKYEALSLDFLNETDLASWSQNLKRLCKSFRKLVNQLPSSVGLFCVLDVSLSPSEPHLVAETCEAIVQLLKAQLKTVAVFKVLITCPIIDPYARWLNKEKMAVDDTIQLPEHVDDKRPCFDALRWDLNAGQLLEEALLQISVKRRKRGG
ncbi:hypothetical protein F5884DRAFT_859969 [Xylogone sp. PMI_703]|nr:hypothetical protein F5884DRAFT_859969 [Xylogone sp. PMI_703]